MCRCPIGLYYLSVWRLLIIIQLRIMPTLCWPSVVYISQLLDLRSMIVVNLGQTTTQGTKQITIHNNVDVDLNKVDLVSG